MTEERVCEFCESVEHMTVCPIGRGLERFPVVNALGEVVGYEWLSPQMAADARRIAAQRQRDDMVIRDALLVDYERSIGDENE